MTAVATITANPTAFINQVLSDLDLTREELLDHFEYTARSKWQPTWVTELADRLDAYTFEGEKLTFELAHSEGGSEGEGEYAERVLRVTVGDAALFLRTTGSYDSYNGTDWSGKWELVEPREVTVIQYFPVK